MKRLVILATMACVLALWSGRSDAATADVAAASVDPPVALVGQPVTFTSTNPCTVACSLTWRRPDLGLQRFGGLIVGHGEQITLTFSEPGSYTLVLDVGELCVGTTQLVCHSKDAAFVDVVSALPDDSTTTSVVDDSTTTSVVDDSTTTSVVDDSTTTSVVDDSTTTSVVDDSTTTSVADDSTTSTTA